ADPIITGAALEDVATGERRQDRIAAGAAAGDDGALAIGQPLSDDVAGGVDAIVDIDDAPGALQAFAIGAAIPRAAAVIDVEHSDAAARPVLDPEAQNARCRGRRAALAFDDKRPVFDPRRGAVR